ncbi:uncharacterized protein LOC131887729 [Tigriopus californicus]|uniref:uncharacterized protein LOC131887729 n=1 Tax=Tigriopus californicus TaxID=6832 RepID=UPI0027DA3AE6|nr:uncharacterized protein LOC131887729 [Tigriopus californicus]
MFKSNLEIINRRWKRHFQGLYEDMISSLRLAGSSPSLGTTLQSHSWSKASVLLGQLLDLPRNRTITLHLFALAWNASLQAKHPDHKHTWIRHALGLALETEDQELVVKTGVRLVELNIETGDLQAADHIAWVLETSNHRQIRMLRLQIQSVIRPNQIPFTLKRIFQQSPNLVPEDIWHSILGHIATLPNFSILFSMVCHLALTRWPQDEKIHLLLLATSESSKEWDIAYEIVVHAIQNKIRLNKVRQPFLKLGLSVARSLWKEGQFEELNKFCESLSFVSSNPDYCALHEKVVEYALKGALRLRDLNRVKDLMRTFPLASESPISKKIRLHLALMERNEFNICQELLNVLDQQTNPLDHLTGFKGLIDIMNGRKTYDINPLHLSNLLDKIWKQIKDPRTQAITLQWMIQIQMELATGSSDFDNPQLIQRIANNVNFCLSKLMAQQDLLPWFSKVLWNASLACISHSHLRSQVLEAASKLFEAQRDIVSQTNCQILIVATQIQIIESKEDCVDKLRLFETLEIMKKQLASLAVDPKKQNVVKIYEFKLALLLEDIALASRIIEKTIEEEYEGCQTFALLYCVLRKYPRKCGTSLWLLEIKALQGLIMCVTRVPGHSAREVFHLFSKLLATGLFIEELELLEEARQTIQEYLKLEYMSEQDVRCLVVMVKNLWNGGVKFGENGQTDLALFCKRLAFNLTAHLPETDRTKITLIIDNFRE